MIATWVAHRRPGMAVMVVLKAATLVLALVALGPNAAAAVAAVMVVNVVYSTLLKGWRTAWNRETPCTSCIVGPMLEFNLLFQRPLASALESARTYP